jgi:energy-coupling factor transporter transmembrane protein EcfT
MESRAWGASKKRTNLYALSLKKADGILVLISIVMLIISLYIWLYVNIPSLVTIISY